MLRRVLALLLLSTGAVYVNGGPIPGQHGGAKAGPWHSVGIFLDQPVEISPVSGSAISPVA